MGFYKITRLANIFTNLFSSKKISKIILFIVLFAVICFLFSNKVFAVDSESVQVSTASNMSISNDGLIVTGSTNLGYFEIEPNYEYTVELVSSSARLFGFGSGTPTIGQQLYQVTNLMGGTSFSFSRATHKYIYFDISNYNSSAIKVTRVPKSDFDYVSKDLASTLSLSNLWDQVGFAVPLIGVAVLFVIGFIIFKKVTGGSSKAKVKF